jgi:uncharacterized membrane protein
MSDWYYAENNEQKGPINESELKANFATNKLPSDTLVWKDGMDNWAPANQVPAFSFRPPPAPAKVQPTPEAPALAAAAPEPPSPGNPESTIPVDLVKLVSTPGEALEVDAEDAENNKIFGILAYLSILVLVPIFAAKESPFAKYHANQGLVLLLLWISVTIVLWIIGTIFAFLPGSLYFVYTILSAVVYFALVLLLILGVINAAAGKCVPLPVIGGVKLLK